MLVGDKLYEKRFKKVSRQSYFPENTKIKKDLFQIYACTNCDIFITEPGGCQYFGLYAQKSIGLTIFQLDID